MRVNRIGMLYRLTPCQEGIVDDAEELARALEFAGSPTGRDILIRNELKYETIRDIASSMGCAPSNVAKIKQEAIQEIRAARDAGMITSSWDQK